MRGLVLRERLRRVRAALVDGVSLASLRRHAEEVRGGQNDARRHDFTLRTDLRIVAFGHRAHILERTAIVTEIFIDRHRIIPTLLSVRELPRRMRGADTPSRIRSRRDYLS